MENGYMWCSTVNGTVYKYDAKTDRAKTMAKDIFEFLKIDKVV